MASRAAPRLVVSPSADVRLGEARAFVRACPPGTEVLLVGASRGSVDDLARSIAVERGATFGLHRFSFTQLAARLAAVPLADRGLGPSSSLGTEAVAARAAFDADRDRALDYLHPVARMPGFARALARTLQELRLAAGATGQAKLAPVSIDRAEGAAPAPVLSWGPRPQEALADLAALLDRFEAQFAAASAADRAALFGAATEALARRSPWTGQPLVLLDVPFESRVEREFLIALAMRSAAVLATVPAGDAAAIAALRQAGAAPEVPPDPGGATDLGRVRRHLFERGPVSERTPTGELRFFSAPGEGRECVEIARRILREAAAGVAFDEIAIFLRSPQSYHGLLEHALARAEVPAYFDRGTRRPHPAGRAFLAILACAVEGLSASRFAEYLSLAQVPRIDPPRAGESAAPGSVQGSWTPPVDEAFGPSAEQPAADTPENPENKDEPAAGEPGAAGDPDAAIVAGTLRAPWRWERLLVESAVVGGADRWRRRLEGLRAEYRLKIRELADEDPASPRTKALDRDLQNLGHLSAFALPLIDTLEDWPEEATWGEWLDRLERIVPRVLRQPGHVLRVLADLRPMGDVGPVRLGEVRDVLADRLLSIQTDPPADRYGRVFIGSPHQARGRAFRVVFVPGIAERVFPQKLRQDPLLLDELREGLDSDLAVEDDRKETERLLLRLAAGAATERLHVSYPRLEIAESRPRVPSFYALDLVRAVGGSIPTHEKLAADAAAETEATLSWPAPRRPEDAIDDLEHDLAALRELLDRRDPAAVRGRAHYLLKLNPCLRRSVTERWARARRAWTPADGIVRVADRVRAALTENRLAARPYSLSALQRFAICPYQFFLSAIHTLAPFEEPQPLQRLDPLQRGRFFHRAQAEFFRALQAQAALPVTEARLPRAHAVLDDVVARVAAEYAEELAPAIPRVWRDEVDSIRRDLRLWVEALARAEDEWEPWLFEFAFGLKGDGEHDPRSRREPVIVGDGFLLRGAVDLVERSRTPRALRVTDHKTGRNRTTPALVIGGGATLQPVLYGLAVEAALGERVAASRLFFCTSDGGLTEHAVPLDEANRRLGIEALEIIDRSVESGFLAPAPAEQACSRCDFRPVCGPNEERRLANKPTDRLRELEALRSRP